MHQPNAEAAGPNVTTVATVTAVTKQPKTLDTNRSEVNGTYPAAEPPARKSVACVTALTPLPPDALLPTNHPPLPPSPPELPTPLLRRWYPAQTRLLHSCRCHRPRCCRLARVTAVTGYPGRTAGSAVHDAWV